MLPAQGLDQKFKYPGLACCFYRHVGSGQHYNIFVHFNCVVFQTDIESFQWYQLISMAMQLTVVPFRQEPLVIKIVIIPSGAEPGCHDFFLHPKMFNILFLEKDTVIA